MTENQIYILLIAIILILLFVIILLVSKKNSISLDSIRRILDDQYQNDRAMIQKTQETSSTLLSLQQQFQTLSSEFHILSKGTYHHGITIDSMYEDLQEMQKIMVNKKARGNWGEYQLETLLSLYIGNNPLVMESQYHLNSGAIGDVALHLPSDNRVLIIDSKFPMENYQYVLKYPNDNRYKQMLVSNIKKHIKDISVKYINEQTLDVAIMFIPSEAIYSYICSECSYLIDDAYKSHVLISSPTTLAGIIFSLLDITKTFIRIENFKEIEKQFDILEKETAKVIEKSEKLVNMTSQVANQTEDLNKSILKLTRQMEKISKIEE